MSPPTAGQLLRRHAGAFAISFVSLTALLLVRYATKLLPQLDERGIPAGGIGKALLLAVPFIAAATIPMSVFLAVLWVFTRLGADGALAAARRERDGIRRLIAPVLGVGIAVAALTLILNAQIVPRANARLAALLSSGSLERTDRMMTIGELRAAARRARADAESGAERGALERAASYEVETQKKYALAASCVVLLLAGAAVALRFHRSGGVVIGVGAAILGVYYVCFVVGETLADRLIMSPVVAMWMANALVLAAALLVMWRVTSSPSRA